MTIKIVNPSVAAAVKREELCNAIIESLNVPNLSPIERYGVSVMLKDAADAAAKILSSGALNHALREPKKDDPNECYEKADAGKHFVHRGFVYGVTKHYEYNYAQPDENGRKWSQTVNSIRQKTSEISALNKIKNALQSIILTEHKLKPINIDDETKTVPMTFGFYPKEKCNEID